MLVVTALGGGGDYTAEMPSMEECLDARILIAEQDPNVKTLCVPMADETAKMQELFGIFMDMIDQIKSREKEEETTFSSPVGKPLNLKFTFVPSTLSLNRKSFLEGISGIPFG